jgi:hypothetical protein
MIVRGFDNRCYTVPDRFGVHLVGDGSYVRIWAGGVTRLCAPQGIGDRVALGFMKMSHVLHDLIRGAR